MKEKYFCFLFKNGVKIYARGMSKLEIAHHEQANGKLISKTLMWSF